LKFWKNKNIVQGSRFEVFYKIIPSPFGVRLSKGLLGRGKVLISSKFKGQKFKVGNIELLNF